MRNSKICALILEETALYPLRYLFQNFRLASVNVNIY